MSRAPASAAERQRRLRHRQRYGLRVVPVEVDEHRVAGLLIDAGYMADTADPDALAQALSRLIASLDIMKIA